MYSNNPSDNSTDLNFRFDIIARAKNNGEEVMSKGLDHLSQKWSEAVELFNCTSPRFDQQQTSSNKQVPINDCYASYLSGKTRKINPRMESPSARTWSERELVDSNQQKINSALGFHSSSPSDNMYTSGKGKTRDFLDRFYSNLSPTQVHSELFCSSEYFRKANNETSMRSTRESEFHVPEPKAIVPVSLFCPGEEVRSTSGDESDESQSIDLNEANRQIHHFRAMIQQRQQERLQKEKTAVHVDVYMDLAQYEDNDDAVFDAIQKIKINAGEDDRQYAMDGEDNKQSCGQILHGISGNAISLPSEYLIRRGEHCGTGTPRKTIHTTLQVNEEYSESETQMEKERRVPLGNAGEEKAAEDYSRPSPSQASTTLASNASYARDLLLRSTQVLRSCPSDEDLRIQETIRRDPVSQVDRSLVQCPFDEDIAWNSNTFALSTRNLNQIKQMGSHHFSSHKNSIWRTPPSETSTFTKPISEPLSMTSPSPLGRSHIKEMALSRIRSRDSNRLKQKAMF